MHWLLQDSCGKAVSEKSYHVFSLFVELKERIQNSGKALRIELVIAGTATNYQLIKKH